MNDIKKSKNLNKQVLSQKFPAGFFSSLKKQSSIASPESIKHDSKNLSKVLKNLDRMPEQSTEKLFYPFLEFSSTVSSISRKPVGLEDLVTVSCSLKNKILTIKKVVDSRNLDLYSVQQYLIENKLSSRKMQKSLKNWKNLNHPSFVPVIQNYWNVPENCLSLICQYFPGSSLDSLIAVLGSVPESILNPLALKLLKVAKWAEENGKKIKSLELFQVFCTKDGDFKIFPNFNEDEEDSEDFRILIAKVLISAVFLDELKVEVPRCCFFHSLKEDVMVKRMSKSFQHFLCRLTRTKRERFEDLLCHPWLGRKPSGPNLKIQEVLKISIFREEMRKVDQIFDSLKVVVDRQKSTRPDTSAVHSFADDLGVSRAVLEKKIQEIFE
jgi:hypothetical protein